MSDTPKTSSPSRSHLKLALMLISLVAVVLVGEGAARRYLAVGTGKKFERVPGVEFIPKDVESLPKPTTNPAQFLLVGNSHTYTLPGRKRGDDWRLLDGPVLPDDVATDLRQVHPEIAAQHYLLSYPNFLPYEMLVRVTHLLHRGYRPRAVIVGITFRNVARDSKLREQIRGLLKDEKYAVSLHSLLSQSGIQTPDSIKAAIRADLQKFEKVVEEERTPSIADPWDHEITEKTGQHVLLLGRNADLRSKLTWDYSVPFQSWITGGRNDETTYGVVKEDYQFNIECLTVLLRILRQDGIRVACYFAPEHPTLPFFLDPKPEERFIAKMHALGEELSIPMLDARALVPEEDWGWANFGRDGSHFHEPGHEKLAKFLVEELDKQGFWQALTMTPQE